jgi:hypothetical protein
MEQIHSLHEIALVGRKENVLLLGPSWRGQEPPRDQPGDRCRAARPPLLLRHHGGSDHPREAQPAYWKRGSTEGPLHVGGGFAPI